VANGPAANDTIRGGGGGDIINDQLGQGSDVDTIFGGKGNDKIAVQEGDSSVDGVDCGPGTDTIIADPNDHLTNCEIVNPS
jgi:Ca2+-binding RTX toxin-like protein